MRLRPTSVVVGSGEPATLAWNACHSESACAFCVKAAYAAMSANSNETTRFPVLGPPLVVCLQSATALRAAPGSSSPPLHRLRTPVASPGAPEKWKRCELPCENSFQCGPMGATTAPSLALTLAKWELKVVQMGIAGAAPLRRPSHTQCPPRLHHSAFRAAHTLTASPTPFNSCSPRSSN